MIGCHGSLLLLGVRKDDALGFLKSGDWSQRGPERPLGGYIKGASTSSGDYAGMSVGHMDSFVVSKQDCVYRIVGHLQPVLSKLSDATNGGNVLGLL